MERYDYTQQLLARFMRLSVRPRYVYHCQDTAILTTDFELFEKLKNQDKKNGFYVSDITAQKLYHSNTEFNPWVKNAILFSTEDRNSYTCNREYVTLLAVIDEKAYDRFAELIPTIIKHHIEKNNIDTKKDNIRVEPLYVQVSRNNCFSACFDHVYSHEFKDSIKNVTAEISRLKLKESNPEKEPTL